MAIYRFKFCQAADVQLARKFGVITVKNFEIPEEYSYIDETRYIGYKPEVEDKTATEVPAYSTLVGDLHAHYVDLVFSLALVGLLAEYFIKEKEEEIKKTHLLLIALLLGICKMTNYWDYPIYIVIISAMFVGKKLVCNKCDKKSFIISNEEKKR